MHRNEEVCLLQGKMIIRKFCHQSRNMNQHITFMKLALRHAQAAYREKEIPVRPRSIF